MQIKGDYCTAKFLSKVYLFLALCTNPIFSTFSPTVGHINTLNGLQSDICKLVAEIYTFPPIGKNEPYWFVCLFVSLILTR